MPPSKRGGRIARFRDLSKPREDELHGLRAREDPQRRRRRTPRRGQDVARGGPALPDRDGQPARDDRDGDDRHRLGRRRAEAADVALLLARAPRVAGAEDQPDRRARRSRVSGRRDRCAAGRRGCALRALGRDGHRGGHEPPVGACLGPRARARAVREHARPRARRLLPHARVDPGSALREVHRRPSTDRVGARAHRHRRRAAHVRLPEPERREGGRPGRDTGRDGGPGERVPREAPRRGRRDGRGADGALPRRPGARRARRRERAQDRGHARRGLSGRVRRRNEEPRHARAPRPARRRRAVAGEEGLADRGRRRRHRCVRVQDDRRPVRRPDQRVPRAVGRRQGRRDAHEHARALEGALRRADGDAGEGAHERDADRRGGHRGRREAEGDADRRPVARHRAARSSRRASASPSR